MTGRVYVADTGASDVTIIGGGATIQAATIGVPLQGIGDVRTSSIVANPVTNQIYTFGSGEAVTVIDGASNAITKLAAGTGLRSLAVNPVTNTVYAINQSGGVTVMAGATSTQPASVVAMLTLSSFSLDIALNPATNRLYVSGQDGTVTVLDGATSSVIAKITVGVPLYVLAANPATNKIYGVTYSYSGGPNETLVLDGASNAVIATLAMDSPWSVAVNPVTNRIYVTNFEINGNVTVMDGMSDAIVATIPAQLPGYAVVNPVANKIYVINASVENHLPFLGTMVIDGASNTVIATVPAGASASPTPSVVAIAVNPLTNHVYIGTEQIRFPLAPSPSTISVIDGISDTIGAVLAGDAPKGIAVNPVTNQVYVANAAPWASSFVTKINEQQTQVVPLPVAIAFAGQPGVDFVGESTVSHNPAFQFAAASHFTPLGMPIQNIYYQVDTWQGRWQPATPSGTNFTGQLFSVSPGNHVLYAYAGDGEDATLWPGNALVGPVAAFPFTVVERLTQVSLGPQSLNGSPDPYHSTVNVVGSGFQPGDILQIVFKNLPDVVPDVCVVCSVRYSHLQEVPAPILAQVARDGTFQVPQIVEHNVERGPALAPVTILIKGTGNAAGIVQGIGQADASYWIGPMPADF
jgi:YVTN family beta-propeller protein